MCVETANIIVVKTAIDAKQSHIAKLCQSKKTATIFG